MKSQLFFTTDIFKNNFFQIYFEKQLKSLLIKHRTKKIINIYTFLNHLKNCKFHHFPIAIFYNKPYFLKILKLLKQEFFIFNYFLFSHKNMPLYIQTMVNQTFLKSFICIIFRPLNFFNLSTNFNNLIFISTPGRNIYITYKQLTKLVNMQNSSLFLLNTSVGLISHKTALKKKIGGSLLCKIS